MYIIRHKDETLMCAEGRPDGSVRVNFYELREYIELDAREFQTLKDEHERAQAHAPAALYDVLLFQQRGERHD